jgi:hypothetical protein
MGALISALVPVPKRAPVRYAALALAGLVVAGGAVAAVWQREPSVLLEPVDVDGKPIDVVGPLVTKINELQEQLVRRDAENRALLAELTLRTPDVEKIQQLQTEIAIRDDKIEQLVIEVAELKGTRLPRRPPPPRQEELASSAFMQAHGDLESCLREWSLRQTGDADLSFKMTASAAGTGHSVEPLPITAGDDRLGPSLRQCAGDVLARVRFAPGPDNLDLHVYVDWTADTRVVLVSARVVARRKATKTLLD